MLIELIDSLSLQSGLTFTADGILGPLTTDLPAEGLDMSDILPAEDLDDDIPPAEEDL